MYLIFFQISRLQKVKNTVNNKVARHAEPDLFINFGQNLPRTKNAKIDRTRLLELVRLKKPLDGGKRSLSSILKV